MKNLQPGAAIKNPSFSPTVSTDEGQRKFSCKFCPKMLSGKFFSHVSTVHKNEPEVQVINSLPIGKRTKGCQLNERELLRQRLIRNLLKEVDHKKIITASKGEKVKTTYRTRRGKPGKWLSEFKICPFCLGNFVKQTYNRHVRRCQGDVTIRGHLSTPLHRLAINDIHPLANDELRKVAIRLRNDDITKVALGDEVIVRHGNCLALKYRVSSHNNKQIRHDIRMSAIILGEAKKIDESIKEMKDLLDKTKVTTIIQVASKLSEFTPGEGFKKSSVARDVQRIMGQVAESWVTDGIEENIMINGVQLQSVIDAFLKLFKKRWEMFMLKPLQETQTHEILSKGLEVLPSANDINKLMQYAKKIQNESLNELNKEFSYQSWVNLGKSLLILILILNRKRPSEVARLKLISFNDFREKINEATNPEFFQKMSEGAKLIAAKYDRVMTRGKKNDKIVPVILKRDMTVNLKFFVSLRERAGVHPNNPYVFGLPNSLGEFRWIQPTPLMAKWSEECGAKVPSLLRGTKLRKHIATIGVALNLNNGQIDSLAKHMGHNIFTHKKNYRQDIVTEQMAEVAKLLEMAQSNFQITTAGNIICEESDEEPAHQSSNNNYIEAYNHNEENPNRDRGSSIEEDRSPADKRNYCNLLIDDRFVQTLLISSA